MKLCRRGMMHEESAQAIALAAWAVPTALERWIRELHLTCDEKSHPQNSLFKYSTVFMSTMLGLEWTNNIWAVHMYRQCTCTLCACMCNDQIPIWRLSQPHIVYMHCTCTFVHTRGQEHKTNTCTYMYFIATFTLHVYVHVLQYNLCTINQCKNFRGR